MNSPAIDLTHPQFSIFSNCIFTNICYISDEFELERYEAIEITSKATHVHQQWHMTYHQCSTVTMLSNYLVLFTRTSVQTHEFFSYPTVLNVPDDTDPVWISPQWKTWTSSCWKSMMIHSGVLTHYMIVSNDWTDKQICHSKYCIAIGPIWHPVRNGSGLSCFSHQSDLKYHSSVCCKVWT